MSTSSLQSTRLLYFSDGARGLQHSTALNDLRLRAVVIAYEVATPFGTQTLHWFAFRGYFFAGENAQLTPHTNKVLWGTPFTPTIPQLLRRGTPRLYNYSATQLLSYSDEVRLVSTITQLLNSSATQMRHAPSLQLLNFSTIQLLNSSDAMNRVSTTPQLLSSSSFSALP